VKRVRVRNGALDRATMRLDLSGSTKNGPLGMFSQNIWSRAREVQKHRSPGFMGLASLGLGIAIFCDSLYSVLVLNASLGLDFLGLALSPAAGAEDREDDAARARGGPQEVFRSGERDATSAQKLGQLQPLIAVFPQGCMGHLASFGPT
jgi:hypothetical protein